MFINKNDWKFFVNYCPEDIEFPSLTTGQLFAANVSRNLLFTFNNQLGKWEESMYNYYAIVNIKFSTKKDTEKCLKVVAGVGFEPHDLRVMSPTSDLAALPRDICIAF